MARKSEYIFYDIRESHLKTVVEDITYYFSSNVNKERFDNKIEDYREEISKRWSDRMGIKIDLSTLADFKLYEMVESRGRRVVKGGVEVWLNNMTLNTSQEKRQN